MQRLVRRPILLAHSSIGQQSSMTQLGPLPKSLTQNQNQCDTTTTSWVEVLGKNPRLCSFRLLAKFCFLALLRLTSSLVAVSWELLSTSRGRPHLFSQGASTFKPAMARGVESLPGFEALLPPPLPRPEEISACKGLTFWG